MRQEGRSLLVLTYYPSRSLSCGIWQMYVLWDNNRYLLISSKRNCGRRYPERAVSSYPTRVWPVYHNTWLWSKNALKRFLWLGIPPSSEHIQCFSPIPPFLGHLLQLMPLSLLRCMLLFVYSTILNSFAAFTSVKKGRMRFAVFRHIRPYCSVIPT